jgi:UDP-2-acetamido-2-deoxy-ribo-hexuluronate aminotransferase
MKKVPFFNYSQVFTRFEDELTEIMIDVCRRGSFIMQQELLDFESNLATFAGSNHALGVANATDGLIIALRAANIGKGDEVIFCSHTMVATAASIAMVGATPVPVEVGYGRTMDVELIATAVTSRTKAIMPTQLNGRVANMDPILEIAKSHNLLVIEDAAQALGARYKGKHAGTFGFASAISFFPAKVLGGFGDGGAVFCQDINAYERLYRLRDHGRGLDREIVEWSGNTRLDNLQAAVLDFKLKDYQTDIDRRRDIARKYNEQLNGIQALNLPPGPDDNDDYFDIYQNYELEAESRDELQSFLAEKGIGTLQQWDGKAVHQWPKLGLNVSLPNTEKFFLKCLMIPMNMAMTDDDINYICETIWKFYN